MATADRSLDAGDPGAVPRIAVIVLTIGRATLDPCLRSLERQELRPYEVIVLRDVDRRGIGWARNQAVALTSAPMVAFLDDDAEAPPNWLTTLIEVRSAFDADVVSGTYEETDPLLAEIRSWRFYPERPVLDDAGAGGNGGNALFRREVLERARQSDGMIWNERLRSGQDIELIWRLRAMGARCAWSPVRVRHLRRTTLASHLRHQYGRGKGIALLADAIRRRPDLAPPQPSLLWGTPGAPSRPRYGRLLVHKVLGPFCPGDFGTFGRYVAFWLGQKAEIAGYAVTTLDLASVAAPVSPAKRANARLVAKLALAGVGLALLIAWQPLSDYTPRYGARSRLGLS